MVSLLGDGQDSASDIAVESIVNALRDKDRTAELQTFVKEAAIANSRQLYRLLLDISTEMLRAGDTAGARTIFDLLIRVEGKSPKIDEGLILETRRRKAHCHRLLDDHLAARKLLLGLLDQDRNPDNRAMVHADLGLLEGHFAFLGEIRIPDDRIAFADVAERLEKGEKHFRDAVELDVRYDAHGHYCLGVLALARENYEEADRSLDRARAHFRSRPKNYPDTILPRVDLYLGIARAQTLASEKLHHASALIVSGLQGGESFPRFLVEQTVSNLGLAAADLTEVTDTLLHTGGDEAIDALARNEAVSDYLPLSQALHERAHRKNNDREGNASDLRFALRGYLKAGKIEIAREILDELQVLAIQGVGVDSFVELLGESWRYEPAWKKEDAAIARARCYESGGEYNKAFQELEPLFHRFMTKAGGGHASALDDAKGMLCVIEQYGLGPIYCEKLQKRYEAVAGSMGDDESEVSESRVARVLFVGGDDRQAKAREAICRKANQRDGPIEIEFVHSGLDSNWGKYANDVKRLLPKHDAVVIMRYIRTNLSAYIRKECRDRNIPWRFCWSAGRGAAIEAVLKAARAGREH